MRGSEPAATPFGSSFTRALMRPKRGSALMSNPYMGVSAMRTVKRGGGRGGPSPGGVRQPIAEPAGQQRLSSNAGSNVAGLCLHWRALASLNYRRMARSKGHCNGVTNHAQRSA